MRKLPLLPLMLISSLAVAKANTSDIYLDSGPILPRSELSISLQQLVPYISYQVTCYVTNPNNSENPVVVSVATHSLPYLYSEIFLNDELIGNGSAQVKLPMMDNSLVLRQIMIASPDESYGEPSINVLNSDNDDMVAVTNCVATAEG